MTGGFSYLLRLPVLRDCTGRHSSLPALGTAEGVLHTHTHNIHTSRFKVLLDRLCEGKSREVDSLSLVLVRMLSFGHLNSFLIGRFMLYV